MSKAFVHVVHKQGNWAVEEAGAAENARPFSTREEAIAEGKRIARQNKVELIVHREDGSIGERDSYGNDPRDIEG